eukprot:3338318-Amphidinium_carterae.1
MLLFGCGGNKLNACSSMLIETADMVTPASSPSTRAARADPCSSGSRQAYPNFAVRRDRRLR